MKSSPDSAARPPTQKPDTAALKAELVAKHGEAQRARIERGVEQVAAQWRQEDGDMAAFVREHFIERGRPSNGGITPSDLFEGALVEIANPADIRPIDVMHGPYEIRTPVAEPDEADPRRPGQSFQTFSDSRPFLPVALRKSTTTCARSTRSS